MKKLEKYKPLGVIASCVSIEHLENIIKDIKKIKLPFGFKINAFQHIPAGWKPDANNPKVQSMCTKVNRDTSNFFFFKKAE